MSRERCPFDLAHLPRGRAAALMAHESYYRSRSVCVRCDTDVKHIKYGCYRCQLNYQRDASRRRVREQRQAAIVAPTVREPHSSWIPSVPAPGAAGPSILGEEGSTPSGHSPMT